MSRFLYFLPGVAGIRDAEELAGHNLGHIAAPGFTRRQITRGPGRVAGLLLCGGESPADALVYDPDLQRWENVGPFWIGFDRGNPPGPADLEREMIHATYLPVELGGVPGWYIPTAIRADGETPLPKTRKAVPDPSRPTGYRIERAVCREFMPLLEIGDELIEAHRHGRDVESDRVLEIALTALQINYRVTVAELSALEVLDDDALSLILYIIIDAAGRMQEGTLDG